MSIFLNILVRGILGWMILFIATGNSFAGHKNFEEKEYTAITFKQLSSFDYVLPEEEEDMKNQIKTGTVKDQIPQEIKALNNKKVAIQGFILPSDLNDNKLKSFVMLANQMGCCFGMPPPFNGWIYVTMTGEGSPDWAQDEIVTVYGTLHVGEVIDSDGGMSLYRMDGDKIKVPKHGFMDKFFND